MNDFRSQHFLVPDWPVASHVKAAISLRTGGFSTEPFASNNLALHVGDKESNVLLNREALLGSLCVKGWQWLDQVHGVELVEAEASGHIKVADGCFTRSPNVVCSVLTADCLPVLMCDKAGKQVLAVHAGWRGLSKGILLKAVRLFTCLPEEVLVYLGPAIGPKLFEVGGEVRKAFQALATEFKLVGSAWDSAFSPVEGGRAEKYLADLYELARMQLAALRVENVYGGAFCTYSEADKFYSYRRDGVTGRMATCIWKNET